jgi:hypothetical protein
MTFEEIVEDVRAKISEDSEFSDSFFGSLLLNEYTLNTWHMTLGTWVRNEYDLWSVPWEPEIRDGVDYSPFHPDQLSATILQEVWKRGIKK